jgi:hypothetical protein
MSSVAALGCIVCWTQGIEGSPATCHHIRNGTGAARRESNWRVLPLCPVHHQQGDGTPRYKGEIAYHCAPRQWEARYGDQESLLLVVVKRLGLEWGPQFESAPSKCVAR